MKKFILSISMALCLSVVFGQTASLRLEMPATMPNPGEDFLVGVYLDELDWPADPTIWSALFAFEYDPAVMTAVSTGPPFNRWFHNHNQMFIDYGSLPQSNVPSPGDLRVFFATGAAYGYDPSFYGFVSGTTPFHFFDLKFTYIGGDIIIDWGTTAKLSPVEGEAVGGKLVKAMTEMYAPPPPAAGVPYTLTLEGVGPDGTPGMWTGAADDGDWFNPGNWDDNMVPPDGTNITIPDIGKAMYPMVSGSITTGTLTIAPAAMLTLNFDGELTTMGLFTNDGDFIINSDNFGYSGSFIDMAGIAGTGTYTFNRDIVGTDPYGDPGGWHFLSTPIAGFDNHQLYDYFINGWDATAQMYDPLTGTYTPPGSPCIQAPLTVLPGTEAWSIKQDITYAGGTNYLGYPDDCEVMYPGTGTNIELAGPFANVHNSALAPLGPLPIVAGWNFYGNPWSSAVDPGAITWGPSTVQSVAMWDGLIDNYYYWSPAVPTNYLAPTQGFFVEGTGADNFSFTGAERIHDAAGTFWGKSELSNLLTLKATNGDRYDQLHVRFMEDMSAQFDMNGDAHKLLSDVPGVPQIYTTVGSEMLAINALPATEQVPMGFTSIESGTFTIEAVETSEFSEVYLQDLVTGEITNMLTDSYTFDFTAGDDPNRFIIHFAPVGIGENLMNSVSIWSNENNIYVSVPRELKGTIAVFNMMGQEVVSTDTQPGTNVIPMDKVNTYYVVKVLAQDNVVTGKVYIK